MALWPELVTAPAEEPLTLAEARSWLRLNETASDADVQSLVSAARQQAELFTGRPLVTQTWRLKLPAFPARAIPLLPNLQSVSSVAYMAPAGASQTLAASAYQVVTSRQPGEVLPAFGTSWPSARCQEEAVTVTFVAGYGGAAAVPEGVKAALRLWLDRTYYGGGPDEQERQAWESLLLPYVVRWEQE